MHIYAFVLDYLRIKTITPYTNFKYCQNVLYLDDFIFLLLHPYLTRIYDSAQKACSKMIFYMVMRKFFIP